MNREVNRNWLETKITWPTCDTCDLASIMAIQGELVVEPEHLPDPVSTVCTGTSTEKEKRMPFSNLSNKQKKRRSDSFIHDNFEEEPGVFLYIKVERKWKICLCKDCGASKQES